MAIRYDQEIYKENKYSKTTRNRVKIAIHILPTFLVSPTMPFTILRCCHPPCGKGNKCLYTAWHLILWIEVAACFHASVRCIVLLFSLPPHILSKVAAIGYSISWSALGFLKVPLIVVGLRKSQSTYFSWYSRTNLYLVGPINIALGIVHFVDTLQETTWSWVRIIILEILHVGTQTIFVYCWYKKIPDFVRNFQLETDALQRLQEQDGTFSDLLQEYSLTSLHLQINPKEELKGGEFGIVCKGALFKERRKIEIAAKTYTAWSGELGPSLVWEELRILMFVGNHENLVRFLGVAYYSSAYYIITEYCDKGSLKLYLDGLRNIYGSYLKDNYIECHAIHYAVQEELRRLVTIIQGICSGMLHIASRKIVHGDLATRNILLTDKFVPKICDYGMSKKLHHYETYVRNTEQDAMPWRWMAIESLEDLKFSEKSDIWAFGVTIWEIFSLGETPYTPETRWSPLFASKLKNGELLLEEPVLCEGSSWYHVMRNCWQPKPFDRPSFQDVWEVLDVDLKVANGMDSSIFLRFRSGSKRSGNRGKLEDCAE